jgi:phage-related protein
MVFYKIYLYSRMSSSKSAMRSRAVLERRTAAENAAAVARRKQTMKNVAKQAANLGKALSNARASAQAARNRTSKRWNNAARSLKRTAPAVANLSKKVNKHFIDHAMNLTSQIQRAAAAALKSMTGRN